MKAAVYHGRRDIRIESVPEPPDPLPGEVVLDQHRLSLPPTAGTYRLRLAVAGAPESAVELDRLRVR